LSPALFKNALSITSPIGCPAVGVKSLGAGGDFDRVDRNRHDAEPPPEYQLPDKAI
jgi:hypothetical protein